MQEQESEEDTHKIELENLEVYTVNQIKIIELNVPILIDGKEVHRFSLLKISECVDKTTGEIIPFSQAEELGFSQMIQSGLLMKQREAILNSLRKEVKDFALFVLKFRNKRGGITPHIDKLCRMYAELHDLRSTNVRRYIKKLKDANILASDQLLCPLFQIYNRSVSSKEHLSEDCIAGNVFIRMLAETNKLHNKE
jgi:hypothetical protein